MTTTTLSSDLDIRPSRNAVPADQRAKLLEDPGFGRVFSDHMVTVRYTEGRGWHDAVVAERGTIALHPAAAVLHYAQEIFEGLKAYPLPDGGVALFRPRENARRFRNSAVRMAMPPVPEDLFLDCVKALATIDKAWIPSLEGGSLYIRPFMFANEAFLGVKPASEYLFVTIACAAASYVRKEAQAVTVWISESFARAAPGGTGAAKCGGNYAASLLPQAEALEHGCDQVVFLDAGQHRYVEEMGGMNLFFVFDDGTLSTPPLGGTILPGITRDCVITMAREQGLKVQEALYAMDDWRADAASGRLREVFACGTAAVIAPVGRVKERTGEFAIGDGNAGPVTSRLREGLVGIQRGRLPDPYGWVERL
jgi:branched-chain amino acid aminotransferase